MPISLNDASVTPSPAVRAATILVATVNNSNKTLAATRAASARMLWSATGATPMEVAAELDPATLNTVVAADIVTRLLQALPETDKLTAFAASSPVPATHTLTIKDAQGNVVDPTAEIVALLTKLSSITTCEIAAV